MLLGFSALATACVLSCKAEVVVNDIVLPMEAGRDFISCGTDGSTWTNHGHSVEVFIKSGTGASCLAYYPEDCPGVRPFRGGPVVLESSGELSGTVLLSLKPLAGGEEKIFTAPWTARVRFDTGLTSETKYVFHRLTFTPDLGGCRAWTVHVRRLYAEVSLPAAEACGLDVDTGNPLHICRRQQVAGRIERPFVVLSNEATSSLGFSGRVALADLCGRRLEIPFKTEVLAPGASMRLELPWPMPGMGLWNVGAEIVGSDGTKTVKETRFAVLDRHVVTPKVPDGKFRLGICYHMERYPGWHRQMTLDAVVASGAKLVRGGTAMKWNDVQHDGPDSWQWSGADEMMNQLDEHGLSLDTIIAANPPWAVNPDVEKRAERWVDWYYGLPNDLGALERFCEQLSRRFGTRVSYYEMGNEWDCNRTMSRADAAAIFTACANGLHRGNPAARMIPCGWASWDPEIDVPYEENMPEGSMVDCKGLYVAHPVHNHGEFRRFREMTLDFLARRKKRGLDDVPWYANETALSTVQGNEIPAAEHVWKKILFAWGYGSCDYIWYNLRATGWNPNDPEQGYGMITADYYPRASYAAFSALATVLTGFDIDSTLKSDGIREVFRFRGSRKGKPDIVIAGWDDNALTGSVIRVKTDAKRAATVDFMGNVKEIGIRNGELPWTIRKRPTALVLHDATRAEPNADDLARTCESKIPEVVIGDRAADGRSPDVVADAVGQTYGYYEANPLTADRVWSGPNDCSFRAWLFRGSSDRLHLRVDVTDDVHSQHAEETRLMSEGDCLRVTVSVPGQLRSWEFGFRRTDAGLAEAWLWEAPASDRRGEVCKTLSCKISRTGCLTRYEVELPISAIAGGEVTEFMMSLKVDDSDGQGRDLWIGFRDLFKAKMPGWGK